MDNQEKEIEHFSQNIAIAEGMPVIAYNTNKTKQIVNGTFCFIDEIKDGNIKIGYPEGEHARAEVVVSASDFSKYYVVGFGISIYKSQGSYFRC